VSDRPELPDLSALYHGNTLNVLADRLVAYDPVKTFPESGMWTNLVRLTDKALKEYSAADVAFADWERRMSERVFSPWFRGIDHLETVITSAHRAICKWEGAPSSQWGRAAPAVTASQE
jgi:hypothetical protein